MVRLPCNMEGGKDIRIVPQNPATPRPINPDPLHLASPDGTFDTHDGASPYMEAVYALSESRHDANAWGTDPYWRSEDFWHVAKKSPDLVAMYFPLLQSPPSGSTFPDTLELIDHAPDYARGLRGLFEEHPDLIPVYARRAPSSAKENDQVLAGSRISGSTDESIVRKTIEENKISYQAISEKLESAEFVEEIEGYPYWIVAKPYEVAQVILVRMNVPTQEGIIPTIRVQIRPIDENRYSFDSYQFDIMSNGMVDSRRKAFDYANIGYCLRDGRIDEKAIVETLVKEPFQTDQIERAFEDIPSLEKHL